MTEHRFTDAMIHDGKLRKTDDGYVVQARVARGGNVQDYLGSEMGGEFAGKAIVRVYRPADAVFARDAISTYARKPITMGHPVGGVSEETWKDLAVGEIDRDVMRDGEFVSVPLLFRDGKAIAQMMAGDGPRELSMGYTAAIVAKDGVTPSGEKYDAEMTDFRMNHVAVVPQARGGAELRIGDGAITWGASPLPIADTKGSHMADNLHTVVLGDAAIQVATVDAAAKLEAYKAGVIKTLTDAQATHDRAIATKDAELATKDARIAELEKAVLTDEALDKRVAERADLIGKAVAIAKDVQTAGLTDAAIRKAAVVAVLGDAAIAGKSDAYVEAMFDIKAADAGKPDAFADAMKKSPPKVTADAQAQEAAAYAAYLGDFNPVREEAN